MYELVIYALVACVAGFAAVVFGVGYVLYVRYDKEDLCE